MFKSSIKSQMDIKKDIMDAIVSDMMFYINDALNNDLDSDAEGFRSDIELNVVICRPAQKITLKKERARFYYFRACSSKRMS